MLRLADGEERTSRSADKYLEVTFITIQFSFLKISLETDFMTVSESSYIPSVSNSFHEPSSRTFVCKADISGLEKLWAVSGELVSNC